MAQLRFKLTMTVKKFWV